MAKILIVDDSKIMRINLKKMLTEMGHEIVAEASDGKQAITEYEAHSPDLVTMDITMPNMDGIHAVEAIIQKDPDAKIIMVSSHGQKEMVINAIAKGAKHYILKPIKSDMVAEVIDKVL